MFLITAVCTKFFLISTYESIVTQFGWKILAILCYLQNLELFPHSWLCNCVTYRYSLSIACTLVFPRHPKTPFLLLLLPPPRLWTKLHLKAEIPPHLFFASSRIYISNILFFIFPSSVQIIRKSLTRNFLNFLCAFYRYYKYSWVKLIAMKMNIDNITFLNDNLQIW